MPIIQSNNIGFGEFGIYNSKNIGYGGMGIYSPENVSNPITEFLKYADLTILPDKADGINSGINSPLTNPMIDLAGGVGKNLFDPTSFNAPPQLEYTLVLGGFTIKALASDIDFDLLPYIKWKQDTQYTFSGICFEDENIKNTRFSVVYTDSTKDNMFVPTLSELPFSYTSLVGKTIDYINYIYSSGLGTTTVKNFMINEGTEALPYEPYGKANVLWQNMAGTVDDGYVQDTVNSKERTFANLDGIDTYGSLVAENAPNPTGLQDFAQLVVFKANSSGFANRYYGITRNLDGLSTRQYSLNNTLDGRFFYAINGASIQILNIPNETLQWVLYGRINGRRFLIRNDVELHESVFSEEIISRQNAQFCSLSSSVDGLTKSDFADGHQGLCAMWYKGDTPLDKDKIVEDSKKMVNYLYGL